MSHMAGLSRRIYCASFIISQFFFAIGGINVEGKCLSEIVMMDTERKFCRTLNNETNKTMKYLKPLCSSACVGAFYQSRYDQSGVALSMDKVSQEIDWSTALSLIKYEGIYHFGGRDEHNISSNRLICI